VENIFAPPPTKTGEFEVKNMHKIVEEAKNENLQPLVLFFFYKIKHVNVRNIL